MKNIGIIFQKEFKIQFFSPIAYVVATMFLLLSGFFFSLILFNSKQASMEGSFYNITIVLIFLTPLLTMRLLAEEKRSGTLEVLLTKPVRDIEVVTGKFLAVLVLFLIILIPTLLYVYILYRFGQPDYGPIIVGYIGIILVAASFLSIGIFASSVTENQIIAAVITFSLLLILWLINYVGTYVGAAGFFDYISVSKHFDDFTKGILDLKHIIFYLSFIGFWIFATTKSIEVRKWK